MKLHSLFITYLLPLLLRLIIVRLFQDETLINNTIYYRFLHNFLKEFP